jgi:hypothetical protein
MCNFRRVALQLEAAVTMRLALLSVLASSALIAGGATAGPLVNGGPTHPVQAASPGPCGYGRIQKTVCAVRPHPPGQPIKICKKVCAAI